MLLPDHWPAYISWSTYEENQTRLDANRSKHKGVPRGGPSLLAGILFCGRCGHRMVTCYRNNGRDLRYDRTHDQINHGAPHCQSLSGGALDVLVTSLMLEVCVLRRSRSACSWPRMSSWSGRGGIASGRCAWSRQTTRSSAPSGNMMLSSRRTGSSPAPWSSAGTPHGGRGRPRRSRRRPAPAPPQLTPADREAIRALAEDIPGLWWAATTTAAERKQIARLLLERVEVTVAGVSENAEVVVLGRRAAEPARAGPLGAAPSSSHVTPSCSPASVACRRKGCVRRRSPARCRRMAGGRRTVRASPRAVSGGC